MLCLDYQQLAPAPGATAQSQKHQNDSRIMMEWGFGMGDTFNIHYNIFLVDLDRDHDPATSGKI